MSSYSGAVSVRLGFISKKNFREDAINNLPFDEDMNGNNGPEYTRQSAIDAGFDTTAEYIVDKCIKAHGETELCIKAIMSEAYEYDSYYSGYATDVRETETEFIVAAAKAS